MQQFHVHVRARHLITCILLLALSSVALLGLVSYQQKAQAASTVNIMPLGDLITGSPGCWRALLWNHLQSTGYTNINFVGTLNNSTACGIPFDGDNEGHGGYLATNIANQNLLPGWLAATNPNIVMMHLGTNDVWNNIAPATILAAFSTLVNQMRAHNPNMRILVAQITPMNPSGCSACAQRVINFNAAIPAWASSKSTAQSPIIVVDQWTGYNDSTDTIDGVHPNASGNAKIAAKWYPPLTAQINSVNGSGGGGGGGNGGSSYEAESSANTLAGGAVVAACSGCSGGSKVGYVGLGGTLQFNNIQASSSGTATVTIYYIDGDTGRSAQMSVNGGTLTTITFHGTNDANWNVVQSLTVSVSLNAGNNTIKFSNASASAPDFDRITVAPTSSPSSSNYEAESSANTLGGRAVVAACSGCSGGLKVGNIGLGGTLQFNNVRASSAGTHTLIISYIDGDAGRSAQMSVNGGTLTTISFHGTNDGNWNVVRTLTVSVSLNAGNNTIKFSNAAASAPDFDLITVS